MGSRGPPARVSRQPLAYLGSPYATVEGVTATDKGVQVTGENTAASMELATRHGITPDDCSRCGPTENWRGPTWDGTDELHDTGDLIWQHNGCGQYSGLSRDEIRERARIAGLATHKMYTVVIEASTLPSPDTPTIWQAMHPAENFVEEGIATAADVALWFAYNQNLAEGDNWRVRVWVGHDADTGVDPDAEYVNGG